MVTGTNAVHGVSAASMNGENIVSTNGANTNGANADVGIDNQPCCEA
jgi:hypothetical protein